MTRLGIVVEGNKGSAGSVGEDAVWTYNMDERWNGTSKLCILLPGHGAGVAQYASNTMGGVIAADLARTGEWVALAIQGVSNVAWGRQACVDAIDNAGIAGIARGCHGPKFAVLGYSAKGVDAGNYYKQHKAKLGAMITCSGVEDLDAAYGTAGHPSIGGGPFNAEIDASYGSYAATAGFRIQDEPASFRGGPPWRLYSPTDDSVVPHSIADNLVAAVADANVALRLPDTLTGNHTGFWTNIPKGEIVTFLNTGNYS